ncbi:hypothetical protein TIFTF001_016624 [Ficus carica]|uniref:Elongation factor P n=1 Tax=Ficus carica TaxID=3494 RepID=A0AA88A0P4_FICCA|nr:hypothetical protein TIFTF001_016624 [Ficus carica]
MRASFQLITKRLSRSLSFASSPSPSRSSPCQTLTFSLKPSSSSSSSSSSSYSSASRSLSDLLSPPCRDGKSVIASPWHAVPTRGLKVNGTNLKVGNVIEKRGVTGPADIGMLFWVELRDVDSGNKVTQRFGTDETVERVFVEAKTYIYMCTDRDGKILLMDPETLDQLEVDQDLFGKKAKYLQDDMKVKVEVYDGIPLSATVPKHVICTVKETPPPVKGVGVTPREKTAVLENGVSIKVPAHVIAGDTVVIDTDDDSYLKRLADKFNQILSGARLKTGIALNLTERLNLIFLGSFG